MWRAFLGKETRRGFHSASRPVINIDNATFYRRYPSVNDTPDSNPGLFPGLSFSVPSNGSETWSVVSPSSIARTTFLQILAGQHLCMPPQARSYPYLSDISQSPQHAIKYVGFDAERGNSVGGTNVRGAYLSARYESRREETDFSVLDYLTGHTELNALERDDSELDKQGLDVIVEQLNLRKLLQMPVANLSNGQTRRARIAKALMAKPEVLLLDGPFMGLDPNTLRMMSEVLHQLAEHQQPRLIMSLRPEDGVPEWVSHLVLVNAELRVLAQGVKAEVLNSSIGQITGRTTTKKVSRDGHPAQSPARTPGEALVEMQGVKVSYGDKTVLGDWQQQMEGEERGGLWWSLHRGQRCGIFGPNGSGKTTMLSLITSDHPQTYSLPIKLFGRKRLPRPGELGISLFDIQKRMGHSSPEVHAFFPKQLTVRRALESAWADAPLSKPTLDDRAKRRVEACLRWFERELNESIKGPSSMERVAASNDTATAASLMGELTTDGADLNWANNLKFRDLSFSNQRLVLFLRALVARPDLIILDEALSGIDEATRDKALLFLSHGEKIAKVIDGNSEQSMLDRMGATNMHGLDDTQALLIISHSKEDVPGCIREWICLPEPGEGKAPRIGALPGPLELNPKGWEEIWAR